MLVHEACLKWTTASYDVYTCIEMMQHQLHIHTVWAC